MLVAQVNSELREALRALLLPIMPAHESLVLRAAEKALEGFGVPAADRTAWVRLEAAEWQERGFASDELYVLVGDCLEAGDHSLGSVLAGAYMGLHAWLCEQPLFEHGTASAFLSHARLMVSLAQEEKMAAAPIARVIAARDRRLPVSWAHVKHVLERLGHKTPIEVRDVAQLYAIDGQAEQALFADADEGEAMEQLGLVAHGLGYPGDLRAHVHALVRAVEPVHGPYLQMLHFLCSVTEFYDSAMGDLYEFNPRGAACVWLAEQYPPSLNVAGNPFLNNAKSVARLDRSWANSKKPAVQHAAHALASIVEGMEGMSFLARQELAAWLRAWLCRLIRLAAGVQTLLPAELSESQVHALLANVASQNSGSRGIIEQRVVDALASLRHPKNNWVSRGLGDSVNASNASRRKLGDCDFQDGDERRVVAYEAHGGVLGEVYLREHRRTLSAVLDRRREEWSAVAGPHSSWNVEVVFVAHGVQEALQPEAFDFADDRVSVSFRVLTYAELVRSALPDAELRRAVSQWVLQPLAEDRTPDAVRATCLALLEAPGVGAA